MLSKFSYFVSFPIEREENLENSNKRQNMLGSFLKVNQNI